MATKSTKRTAKPRTRKIVKDEIIDAEMNLVPELAAEPVKKQPMNCRKALGLAGLGLLAVLGIFWYKTNTWPIAAIANGRIITRFSVNKNLYAQGGASVLDNLVTEQLVKSALDREKITVSADDVNKKYEEIKKQIPDGTDLKTLLAARGMTEADLKNQIELQLRVEKAVSGKVDLTDEQIDKYVAENETYLTGTSSAEKRLNAIELLKAQQSQTAISGWVEKIRKEAKVWTPDGSWKATETAK